MNISMRQILAFETVARLQSFSRAADEIHITQAGLSLMIKDLEGQLGFRLFDRTTRTVNLTPAGSRFLPVVNRSMQDIGEAITRLARDEKQAQHFITVAATPLVCGSILPAVLHELRGTHPEIRVIVKDSERAQIQSLVESAEVDLGLGILVKAAAGVQHTLLRQLSLVCISPSRLEKTQTSYRKSIRWSDLRDKTLIALPSGNALQQLIDSKLEQIHRANDPRMTFNNLLTVIAMVEAGLGHAVLPSFVREACQRYDVELHELTRPHVPIDFFAITRRGSILPAAGPVFIEAFTQHMNLLESGVAG